MLVTKNTATNISEKWILTSLLLSCQFVPSQVGIPNYSHLRRIQTHSYKQSCFRISRSKLYFINVWLNFCCYIPSFTKQFCICLIAKEGIPQQYIEVVESMRIVASPPDGPADTVERPDEDGSLCLFFLLAAHFYLWLSSVGVYIFSWGECRRGSKPTANHLSQCELPPIAFREVCSRLCSAVWFLVGTNCTFFSNPETLCGCANTKSAVAYLV